MSLKTNYANAERFALWIESRKGLAIWNSINLSDPGKQLITPVLDPEGKPATKPHWGVANEPSEIITDPAQVILQKPKEFKRFRVAIRPSGNGLAFKCTDASSRKIRATLEKASEDGSDSWYEFDYENQEAVVYIPGDQITLADYIKETTKPKEVA